MAKSKTQQKLLPLELALAIVIILALLAYVFGPWRDRGNQENLLTNNQLNNNMVTATAEQAITKAILKTSSGNIEIQFFKDKAPATVANFIKLSQASFYDGVKFHRVIKDFMIQSGDPLSKGDNPALYGRGGPGYTFPDEINDQKIVQGVIAMANSGPNTNGSQFFIVTAAATPWLDGKHTVFGRVISGMDVVNKINNVLTGENDIPKTPIVINSVELE